jgi:hypothetical protein
LKRWILISVVCAAPGHAADLDKLLACRDLSAAEVRLACFDRESEALMREPAASLAATQAPTGAAAATAPLSPEQKFGLSGAAIAAKEAGGNPPEKESKLQARITALAVTGDGRTLFTLDNLQVWRQLQADGTDVLARLGDAVTISRGMLGSYWLQLKSGRGCRVTRLR